MANNVKIFLFHRVSPVRDIMWDPMDPALFRKLIKYISCKYSVHTVEDLFINGAINDKRKPLACITFDDGYKDFLQYALPVLDEFKLRSSMYVVTECVSNGLPPWTYIIDYIFFNTKKSAASSLKDMLDAILPGLNLKWNNDEERIHFCKVLKPEMKKMPDKKRIQFYKEIVNTFDDISIPANMMMSWDEVMQAKSAGVVIGSHTVSHPLLAKMEDEDEMLHELCSSGGIIKEKTGEYPDTISYPVGSYNDKVLDLSVKCGYKLGLAVRQKTFYGDLKPAFDLPRIELYNESYIKSRLRASGAIEYIKKFI